MRHEYRHHHRLRDGSYLDTGPTRCRFVVGLTSPDFGRVFHYTRLQAARILLFDRRQCAEDVQ